MSSDLELSWTQRCLLLGAGLIALYNLLGPSGTLLSRVAKNLAVYAAVPWGFYYIAKGNITPSLDRTTARNTGILLAAALPFYTLAGSIPEFHAYYPVYSMTESLTGFLEYEALQIFLAVGTETVYRGLLCVWISGIGLRAVLVSPIVYSFEHLGKPIFEVLGSVPADLGFGYADFRSDSVIPSVVAHAAGMAIVDFQATFGAFFPYLGIRISLLTSTVLSLL